MKRTGPFKVNSTSPVLGSNPGLKRNLTVEKSKYFGLGGFLHRVGGTRCTVAEFFRAGNRDQRPFFFKPKLQLYKEGS